MATVVGVNEVSGGIPKNSWYNDLGRLWGRTTEKGVDALLAVVTAGMAKGGQQPIQSPHNPGRLQMPNGSSTPTSPGELEQIRKLGGIPTNQGQIIPLGQPGATQPGGANYLPPVPQTQDQADFLKTLRDIDPNSPINQERSAAANILSRYINPPGAPSPQPQPQGASSSFYQSGDVITRGSQKFKIVGIDTDGMPLVEQL